MENLLEAIRVSIAQDASPEARAAGADACRTILTALDAKPGEPIAPPVAAMSPPIATIVSALRGMPADQLLDLAIARVRAALPANVALEPTQGFKFQRIPMPGTGG